MKKYNLDKYKANMERFQNCSTQIQNQINLIDSYLRSCDQALEKFYGSSSSLSGDVIDKFFEKSDYCKTRLKIFIDELREERDNLNSQIDKAKEEYDFNKKLYDAESNSIY